MAAKQQRLPLVSSRELINALTRLGFQLDTEGSGGSHISMYRERPDGHKDITTVVRSKPEIPRGTLTHILRLANVSNNEFIAALRGRKKR